MKTINRYFLDNEQVNTYLEPTEEEHEALMTYQHDQTYIFLNELLGCYLSDEPPAWVDKYYYSVTHELGRDNVQSLIDTAVRIYSAMYKNTILNNSIHRNNYSFSVGRGSTKSLLIQDVHGFISTSTLRDRSTGNGDPYQDSINWTRWNNRGYKSKYLSKIEVSPDVPHIRVDEVRIADEREILLSPFVEIEKNELASRFSNGTINVEGDIIREEFLKVKARPLRRMTKEEQERLRHEIFSQIEYVDKCLVEYYSLMKEYESLEEKSKSLSYEIINGADEYTEILKDAEKSEDVKRKDRMTQGYKEFIQYQYERVDSIESEKKALRERIEENKKIILEWRKKCSALIEAMCADKEMEIDSALDGIIAEQKKKEAEKLERQRER